MDIDKRLCELDVKDIQSKESFALFGTTPVRRNREENLKSAHRFLDVLSTPPLDYPIVFINSMTGSIFEIQPDRFSDLSMGVFFKIAREYDFDSMRQDTINNKKFTKVYCIKRESNE